MRNRTGAFETVVCLLCLLVAQAGYGCATCFGDKDSPMTHGMNAGIFVLFGFIGLTLAAFAAFFVYLWWRAKNPVFQTMELGTESIGAE